MWSFLAWNAQERGKIIHCGPQRYWQPCWVWEYFTYESFSRLTDLGRALRWWMQQSIPVSAAPMRNEAKDMATAISAGTPTMTTWDEWRLGDSGVPLSVSLMLFTSVTAEKLAVSNSTGSLRSMTFRGPLRDNCWAAGPTCQSSEAHFDTGSTHCNCQIKLQSFLQSYNHLSCLP